MFFKPPKKRRWKIHYQDLLTNPTGLCKSRQERVPQSPATLDPRVCCREQIVRMPVGYQDWIHDSVALQCRPAVEWRVDQRTDGRV